MLFRSMGDELIDPLGRGGLRSYFDADRIVDELATMPKAIAELGRQFINNPVRVEVAPQATTAERVDQFVTHVNQAEKQALLTLSLKTGLADGKVDIVAGGYADWEARRAAKPEQAGKPKPAVVMPSAPAPPRTGKLTYKDQRDYDQLPARIEALDAAIVRDEAALHDPALYSANPAKFAVLTKAIDAARAEKDAAEERWLALAELVEG